MQLVTKPTPLIVLFTRQLFCIDLSGVMNPKIPSTNMSPPNDLSNCVQSKVVQSGVMIEARYRNVYRRRLNGTMIKDLITKNVSIRGCSKSLNIFQSNRQIVLSVHYSTAMFDWNFMNYLHPVYSSELDCTKFFKLKVGLWLSQNITWSSQIIDKFHKFKNITVCSFRLKFQPTHSNSISLILSISDFLRRSYFRRLQDRK